MKLAFSVKTSSEPDVFALVLHVKFVNSLNPQNSKEYLEQNFRLNMHPNCPSTSKSSSWLLNAVAYIR